MVTKTALVAAVRLLELRYAACDTPRVAAALTHAYDNCYAAGLTDAHILGEL